MLTPDQITASAPDAASLKAGRGLATPRKWGSAGGDDAVLWGLAMGSGKDPYQTRVSLSDLASKCSCPSRKFPCKHALGLMFLAVDEPTALTQKERPPWVSEWLDSRAAREWQTSARAKEKPGQAVDARAAGKRKVQREGRVGDGIALLRQAIHDLVREGLASSAARDAAAWESLARRMVDAQAPGLAGSLRHLADMVLREPDVDEELPLELGRLHLLLHACANLDLHDGTTRAELLSQLGVRASADDSTAREEVEDDWFVAGRRVEERDRLITSASWLFGSRSRRWARVLRFTPVPQTIAEPWPLGSTVKVALAYAPGLFPLRALPEGDGFATHAALPAPHDDGLEALLGRFAAALAANPFLRVVPFFMPLRSGGGVLADSAGRALPWRAADDLARRVECIAGGHAVPMCGEWDGRFLRLLAIRDGDAWIPLAPQQP